MPAGTVFVWMPLVRTVVPFLAGMKTSVDQVGWFMSPAAGRRDRRVGEDVAGGVADGRRCRVAVQVQRHGAVERVVARDDEVRAVDEVRRWSQRERSTAGVIAKSGISMTVPL